jgi:RND family efflux transporter MFP subunit
MSLPLSTAPAAMDNPGTQPAASPANGTVSSAGPRSPADVPRNGQVPARKSSRWRRWSFSLVAGVLGFPLLLYGGYAWMQSASFGSDPNKLLNLQFQEVTRGDVVFTIVEKGELEATRNTDVVCRVRSEGRGSSASSTIKWLVEDGAIVRKGDRLVELDASGLQTQLKNQQIIVAGAEASLTQAENDRRIVLAQNDNDIKVAENNVALCDIDLRKYTEGDLQYKLSDVDGRILIAESDLTAWKDRVAFTNRMVRQGYVTRNQSISDEARFRSAEVGMKRLFEERRLVKDYESKRMELDFRNKLEQAKVAEKVVRIQAASKLAQADANYQAKHAILEAEKSKLKDLQEDIAHCTIVAPNDGMVVYYLSRQYRSGSGSSQRITAIGEPVSEGQRLMRIPDLRRMQANIKVHESLVPYLRPVKEGSEATPLQPARIKLTALEQPLHGYVKSVSTVASSVDDMSSLIRVYTTIVAIDEDTDRLNLKPGMSVEVTVFVDKREDVVRLPVHAVLEVNEEKFCYVQTDNGVVKRTLVTGLNNNRFVEIKKGLEEGELVVQNPRQLAAQRGDLQANYAADAETELWAKKKAPAADAGPGKQEADRSSKRGAGKGK